MTALNLGLKGLTLVLLNCFFLFFIHLKLELLTQISASNDKKYLYFHQDTCFEPYIFGPSFWVNPFSAGIVFRRPNLTSKDVSRTERINDF